MTLSRSNLFTPPPPPSPSPPNDPLPYDAKFSTLTTTVDIKSRTSGCDIEANGLGFAGKLMPRFSQTITFFFKMTDIILTCKDQSSSGWPRTCRKTLWRRFWLPRETPVCISACLSLCLVALWYLWGHRQFRTASERIRAFWT